MAKHESEPCLSFSGPAGFVRLATVGEILKFSHSLYSLLRTGGSLSPPSSREAKPL